MRDELIERLEALPGPDGPIGTRVYRPEDLWHERRGIPPDLVVYFGNLAWRSNGSVGHGPLLHLRERHGARRRQPLAATGSASCRGAGIPAGRRDDLVIYDVAPTILRLFDLPAVDGMRGRARDRA